MKKTKKNFDEKKAKKIRVIVSAILLVLFAIGWIIYGLSLLRTNDKTILQKFFKDNVLVDKVNLEFKNNYINYSYGDKNLGLYKGDNLLYVYGNNKYYDLYEHLKSSGITINDKEFYNEDNYRVINEEIHKIIIEQYKYVKVEKKYLELSNLYEYDYEFNTTYLILSMSGNKNIMETLSKMFNDNKAVIDYLKKNYGNRRLEYTIFTKGKKREIVSYKISLEDVFTYSYKDGVVTGSIDDVVFYKDDKKLLLINDDWEKEITLNNNVDINFEEYKKLIEYDGLYNLIK